MRISKLVVPENTVKDKGLKGISLTSKPLNPVVALIGKNGAGKTRILKIVEKYFEIITVDDISKGSVTCIPDDITGTLSNDIAALEAEIQNKVAPTTPPQHKQQLNVQLHAKKKELYNRTKLLGHSYIKFIDQEALKEINKELNKEKRFTFEQVLAGQYSEEQAKSRSEILSRKKLPIDNFSEFDTFTDTSAFEYLNNLASRILAEKVKGLFGDSKSFEDIDNVVRTTEPYKKFEIFRRNIERFLGLPFSFTKTEDPLVNKSILLHNHTKFNFSLLSPGQRTLLAYAIMVSYLEINSKTDLGDCIIIIDEPEKHLHPEAQILVINAFKEIVKDNGQLWIATHSINILAHLKYDEIFMVKDGEIVPPSRNTPSKSYNDLMGLDDHIEELTSFVTSISDWAFSNFILECFNSPETVFDNDPEDQQYRLFREFIQKRSSTTLLDFGAGEGRFGYTLSEDIELSKGISYYAYEPNESCLKNLKVVPNIKEIYNHEGKIPASIFDIVLLCNVLHEIDPVEWEPTFIRIKNSLKDDGFLLIVEDKFIPKGENSHKYGYLILSFEQLKILFNNDASQSPIVCMSLKDENYKERIVLAAIQKDHISTNPQNIKDAVKSLRDESYKNIKNTDFTSSDCKGGRMYANQVQLYVNACRAFDDL